jgi:hypothetical protein
VHADILEHLHGVRRIHHDVGNDGIFCHFKHLGLLLFDDCKDIIYEKKEIATGIFEKQRELQSSIATPFCLQHGNLLLGLHLCKAIAAVNRAIISGLERHTCLAAAYGAGCSEVLARTVGSGLAGVTASLAALGLVLEAALCVKTPAHGRNTNSWPHSLQTKVLSSYISNPLFDLASVAVVFASAQSLKSP